MKEHIRRVLKKHLRELKETERNSIERIERDHLNIGNFSNRLEGDIETLANTRNKIKDTEDLLNEN